MTIITTRLTVTQDGTISAAEPIPAGQHVAAITLSGLPSALPGKPFTMEDFPVHQAHGMTLSRFTARTCTATMDAEPAFVDTNVLVYASQRRSAFHRNAAGWLEEAKRERKPLWISRQILREYLATVSRPQTGETPLPMAEALIDTSKIQRDFNIAEDGPDVTAQLCRLPATIPAAGKQVHDANIAATMLAHGIKCRLTFNTADFGRFDALIELVAP